MKALAIIGLSLTLIGALVLALRDLRGRSRITWDDLGKGLPRREAWIGFPLIALGSAFEIAAVALS